MKMFFSQMREYLVLSFIPDYKTLFVCQVISARQNALKIVNDL